MAKRYEKSKSVSISGVIAIISILSIISVTAFFISKDLSADRKKSMKVFNETNTQIENLEPGITGEKQPGVEPEQGAEDKHSETAPEESSTSENTAAAQPVEAKDKYVDFVIENYLNIYVSLVNDDELEFYYLDNVVLRDSKFYKALTEEIQKLREENAKYSLDDFTVENVSKGEKASELIVQVLQKINNKNSKYSYTVYFDKNGVFIKGRK